ncbi:hypothetical protein D3H34_32280, partial [Acidovorax cavernicola]
MRLRLQLLPARAQRGAVALAVEQGLQRGAGGAHRGIGIGLGLQRGRDARRRGRGLVPGAIDLQLQRVATLLLRGMLLLQFGALLELLAPAAQQLSEPGLRGMRCAVLLQGLLLGRHVVELLLGAYRGLGGELLRLAV